ncbi:solute carrier family 28 member 3-like isoform X2 [Acanthaster planci]|uniref:Sodium/nucleoside cotransporter n=1 Tax=Acanthaster planci TaxID=133434 RepID=A0A8B8A2D5_ACAPL|nr:solute carrier family 28 member 3-like isoform X2 [Acanthaster planci]
MEYTTTYNPDSGNFSTTIDFPPEDSKSWGNFSPMTSKKPVSRALDTEYGIPLNEVDNPAFDASKPVNAERSNGSSYDPERAVDETDGDDDQDGDSKLWMWLDSNFGAVKDMYTEHHNIIWNFIFLVLLLAYLGYLIYACLYDFQEAMILVIITGIALGLYMYSVIRDFYGKQIYDVTCKPGGRFVDKYWRYIRWPLYLLILAGVAVALVFLTKDNPVQLISAGGLVAFILFCYVFSKHPRHVKWRPVIWGLALQFILGLFILRTSIGFEIFNFLGDVVQTFLEFTDAGSEFVFGAGFQEHFFAFKVLPVVIYFSACISIFYYLGVMQVVIAKLAWLMQKTMHTSASESLNAAGNIFVGQTEAPLLIRPYLPKMTRSELHAVMTGGFATIAGSVLGAYISFGISASHLLSASVMSAPAALAIAKLFYPETEKSQTRTAAQVKLPKGEERNIIEAASTGASTAIMLALNIGANLIAFLALLALFNGLLGYLGEKVGIDGLSFELICSYVFIPVAFLMGVEWDDCRIVAELIGTKTFINEFVAYERLAVYINNRATDGATISMRSQVIATYALCGFANLGSVGIQLGGLTPMAPSRKGDLASVAVRALIAGTVACFMTACIAGILYVPQDAQEQLPTTVVPGGILPILNMTTPST